MIHDALEGYDTERDTEREVGDIFLNKVYGGYYEQGYIYNIYT